jgi:hypothetical protein
VFSGCAPTAKATDPVTGTPNNTTAAAVIDPQFSPTAGTFSVDQSVAISTTTSGATIYYTTDGTVPTAASSTYSAPISVAGNTTTMTIKAMATASGMSDSTVVSAAYIINYAQVSTPQFSVAAGSYNTNQNVTITCATAGVSIYYTTNGSVPTTASSSYSAPIAVAGNGTSMTISAIAVKSGMIDSTVGSAAYTIDTVAPTNQNSVVTVSASVLGGGSLTIVAAGTGNTVWLAPAGTTVFVAGPTMTSASGTATSITVPSTPGTYVLYVVDAAGNISVASTAVITVGSGPGLSYTGSPFTLIQNVLITAITPTLTGNAPTNCTSSPLLPTGLSINTTSCQITGTPTVPQTSAAYTITATNAFGNATANINIIVNYYFGGTLSGLTGTLILQNNGANDLTLTNNGAYQFVNGLANGSAYKVTVISQPTNQGCTIANSVNTVSGLDVTNVNVTCATSGTEDTVNWNKTVTSTGNDSAKAIATDSMGNVYVAGNGTNLVNGTSGSDWWIKKYSSAGVEDIVNWNKSFSSAGTNADSANAIAIDSANNIYVVGMGYNLANGTSGQDWWMKKFSSAGVEDAVNWNKSFSSTGTNFDEAFGVAIDSATNVYVVGSRPGGAVVKKFNSNGIEDTLNWNKKLVRSGDVALGAFFGLVIDAADNVYVVGSTFNAVSDYNWWITKFNSNGVEDTVNWNKAFDSSGNTMDEAYSIAIDSANNIYVVGYGFNLVNGASSYDWWIKKFSSVGVEDTVNWNKIFSSTGTNSDYAKSIKIDSSDNIYVVGNGNNFTGATFQDWWLKKFNANGVEDTVNWNKMIDFFGVSDNANSVTVGTGGDIYVAGDCNSADSNWCIKKFAP